MFGDEPYGNYNRILLSGVLAGTHDPKDIFINPLAWYEQHGVTLHAGVARRANRPRRAQVIGADGTVEPYDELVIATGSTAVRPADRRAAERHGGRYRDGVFVFRTLDDCARNPQLRRRRRARAAVIGGGLLGLEAARGLRELRASRCTSST